MNDIPQRQNSEPFIHLLRARDQLYTKAAHIQSLQLIATIAVPIIGAIAGLFYEPARPYVAVLTLAIVVADTTWIDRAQRRKLRVAATISEQFDCELLDIPWNNFLVGRKVDAETITSAARKWKRSRPLENWYSSKVGNAPLHIARLLCQRTNVWYDKELRRKQSNLISVFSWIVVAALFTAGLVIGVTLLDFVATILAPTAPILIWSLRDYFRQRDITERLTTIKSAAEELIDRAAAGECSEDECKIRSRAFQDAIFDKRASSPPLVPFVYAQQRPAMEDEVEAGVADFLKRFGIHD